MLFRSTSCAQSLQHRSCPSNRSFRYNLKRYRWLVHLLYSGNVVVSYLTLVFMRLLLGILSLCIVNPLHSQEISDKLIFNILNTGITENIADGQLFSEQEALFLNSKNELFRMSNGAASQYSTPEHLQIGRAHV